MLRKLALLAIPSLLVARSTAARAGDDENGPPPIEIPETSTAPAEEAKPKPKPGPPEVLRGDHYYPPTVDGPALRLPESPTRLYVDGSFAKTDDLTALPLIAGTGQNYRLALGGVWRRQRFMYDAQIPLNLTRLNVTSFLNGLTPIPEDARQTKFSLGDITLGAVWTERLSGGEGLIGGLGLRLRLPTHTTRFTFHLLDGSLADFTIAYYFHLEPTLILGGTLGDSDFGRFNWVINQGVIVLAGPDGDFSTEHITVPTVYMWDAHYAIGWAPWSFLGASVEVATTIQLNHVPASNTNFARFNDVRAVWVAPALQVHLGNIRIDAIARIGASRGQEFLGVLEYVGTHSVTLRVTRMFD